MSKMLEPNTFVFHGVGRVSDFEVRPGGKTFVILTSDEDVRHANGTPAVMSIRVQYDEEYVGKSGVQKDDVVACQGLVMGWPEVRVDAYNRPRVGAYLLGQTITLGKESEPQGFQFEARGRVEREPVVTGKFRSQVYVVLEQKYEGLHGPMTPCIVVNAVTSTATGQVLGESSVGSEMYVSGRVNCRPWTSQTTGEIRWNTDFYAKDAVVLSPPTMVKNLEREAPVV